MFSKFKKPAKKQRSIQLEELESRHLLAADIFIGEGSEVGWSRALEQGLIQPVDAAQPFTSAAEQFYGQQIEQDPNATSFSFVDVTLTPNVLVQNHDSLVMSWPRPVEDPTVLGIGAWDLVYPNAEGEDLSNMVIRFSVLPPQGVWDVSLELIDAKGNSRGWFDVGPAPEWANAVIDPTDLSPQGFDVFVDDPNFDVTNVTTIRLDESWMVDPQPVPGDIDGDGGVDFPDFLILADDFGQRVDPPGTGADLDGDGKVDFPDFLILSANFGSSTRLFQDIDPATRTFTPWNAWDHLEVAPKSPEFVDVEFAGTVLTSRLEGLTANESFSGDFMMDTMLPDLNNDINVGRFLDPWQWHWSAGRFDPWDWLQDFEILVIPEFEGPIPPGPGPLHPFEVFDRLLIRAEFNDDRDMVMGEQLKLGSVFETAFDFAPGTFQSDSLMHMPIGEFLAGRSFLGGGMQIVDAAGEVLMTGEVQTLNSQPGRPPAPEFVDVEFAGTVLTSRLEGLTANESFSGDFMMDTMLPDLNNDINVGRFLDPWQWHWSAGRFDPWDWLQDFEILVIPEFEGPIPPGPGPLHPFEVFDRLLIRAEFNDDRDMVMGEQLKLGSVFETAFDFAPGTFQSDSLMHMPIGEFLAGRSFLGGGMQIVDAAGELLMTGEVQTLNSQPGRPPAPEFVDVEFAGTVLTSRLEGLTANESFSGDFMMDTMLPDLNNDINVGRFLDPWQWHWSAGRFDPWDWLQDFEILVIPEFEGPIPPGPGPLHPFEVFDRLLIRAEFNDDRDMVMGEQLKLGSVFETAFDFAPGTFQSDSLMHMPIGEFLAGRSFLGGGMQIVDAAGELLMTGEVQTLNSQPGRPPAPEFVDVEFAGTVLTSRLEGLTANESFSGDFMMDTMLPDLNNDINVGRFLDPWQWHWSAGRFDPWDWLQDFEILVIPEFEGPIPPGPGPLHPFEVFDRLLIRAEFNDDRDMVMGEQLKLGSVFETAFDFAPGTFQSDSLMHMPIGEFLAGSSFLGGGMQIVDAAGELLMTGEVQTLNSQPGRPPAPEFVDVEFAGTVLTSRLEGLTANESFSGDFMMDTMLPDLNNDINVGRFLDPWQWHWSAGRFDPWDWLQDFEILVIPEFEGPIPPGPGPLHPFEVFDRLLIRAEFNDDRDMVMGEQLKLGSVFETAFDFAPGTFQSDSLMHMPIGEFLAGRSFLGGGMQIVDAAGELLMTGEVQTLNSQPGRPPAPEFVDVEFAGTVLTSRLEGLTANESFSGDFMMDTMLPDLNNDINVGRFLDPWQWHWSAGRFDPWDWLQDFEILVIPEFEGPIPPGPGPLHPFEVFDRLLIRAEFNDDRDMVMGEQLKLGSVFETAFDFAPGTFQSDSLMHMPIGEFLAGRSFLGGGMQIVDAAGELLMTGEVQTLNSQPGRPPAPEFVDVEFAGTVLTSRLEGLTAKESFSGDFMMDTMLPDLNNDINVGRFLDPWQWHWSAGRFDPWDWLQDFEILVIPEFEGPIPPGPGPLHPFEAFDRLLIRAEFNDDRDMVMGEQLKLGSVFETAFDFAPGTFQSDSLMHMPIGEFLAGRSFLGGGMQIVDAAGEVLMTGEVQTLNSQPGRPPVVVGADFSIGEGSIINWASALEQGLLHQVGPNLDLSEAEKAFVVSLVEQHPEINDFGVVPVELTPDVFVSDEDEEHSSLVVSWVKPDAEILGLGAFEFVYPMQLSEDLSDRMIHFSLNAPKEVWEIMITLVDANGNSRSWLVNPTYEWEEGWFDPSDASTQGNVQFFGEDSGFDVAQVTTIRLWESWLYSGDMVTEVDPASGLPNPWASWNHLTVSPKTADLLRNVTFQGTVLASGLQGLEGKEPFSGEFMLDLGLRDINDDRTIGEFRDPWQWHWSAGRFDPWDWIQDFEILVIPEFEGPNPPGPDPIEPVNIFDRFLIRAEFDDDDDIIMGDQLKLGSLFETALDFQAGTFGGDSLDGLPLGEFITGRGFLGGGMQILDAQGEVLMTGQIDSVQIEDAQPDVRAAAVDEVFTNLAG